MTTERTFVMVKPDAVARGLVGEVISRLERRGLQLLDIRLLTMDVDMARTHYEEHRDKPFFSELIAFITSGPAVAMAWVGESSVSVARAVMGDTDPKVAAPGTIRGDYGLEVTKNLVHGSDSPDSAKSELALFFPGLST